MPMSRFLVLALAVFTMPAIAQRGGGSHGAASHGGGFSGTSSMHSSFSGSGARSFGTAPRVGAPRFVYGRAAGPALGYRGPYSPSRPAFYSNYRRRPGYPVGPGGYQGGGYGFGAGTGYGNGAGAYVTPYEIGYPDFAGYNSSAAVAPPYIDDQQQAAPQQNDAPAQDSGQSSLQPGYQPEPQAPQMAYAPRASAPAAALEPEDAVTLIYKDGRSEQIHNYALTRTTLYVTGKHHRDIPLDQLDLAATEKVNHDAGVIFALPETK